MRPSRTALIYAAMLAVSAGAFLLIRFLGRSLVAPETLVFRDSSHTATTQADIALGQVLLALIVIIIVARALGSVFQLVGQPRVIGEMVAGILLGPSLLGRVAPGISAYVFPAAILPFLSMIAQIGV